MNQEELSPEWVAFTYKIMGKYQKEQGEQEYDMYYDVDIPKITAEVTQHYQNKVVEYLNNRHKQHLELATNTNSELLREACIQDCKTVKAILDDLTNLKP